MKIAILGTGSIGSTFAFQLARHAHQVTVIARGKRLEQLQAEQAIVTVSGEREAVTVSAALDPAIDFDLVLVVVLDSQVEAVLPALKASAAKTVMFMFNTLQPFSVLREAVGPQRFAFGFPAINASLTEGKLKFQAFSGPASSIASDAVWAKVFSAAGLPTVVHNDIQAWVHTHVALMVPLMSLGSLAHTRQAGVSWAEAQTYALALREGFALAQQPGDSVTPSALVILKRAPKSIVAALFWALSRLKIIRDIGELGPLEPRALIDRMLVAAPEHTSALRAIRP